MAGLRAENKREDQASLQDSRLLSSKFSKTGKHQVRLRRIQGAWGATREQFLKFQGAKADTGS